MKPKQIKETIIKWEIVCPYCKLKIKGYTEGQVKANLEQHIQFKHKEKKQND